MTLKSKIDQLMTYIRDGTGLYDWRVIELLSDAAIKDYISKPHVGCIDLGCGRECNTDWHGPLHFAANEGKYGFVDKLLKHGANVNSIQVHREFSMTPLHCAIQKNKLNVIQMLMDSGANPDRKGTGWDFKDQSPLEYIRKKIRDNHGITQDHVRIAQDLKKKSVEGVAGETELPLKLGQLETALKLVPNLKTKRDQIDHLSDLEIICQSRDDETIFKCHKFVLSICSPVFFDIFKDDDSEVSRSGKLIVKGISVHVMRKFLDFLYEDGLENVDLDDVEELLKVGKRYKVDGLKVACEQELIKILTISNCVFMLHLAKKVGGNLLEEKAHDMVMKNLSEVVTSKDFMLLMQDFPDALYEKRD